VQIQDAGAMRKRHGLPPASFLAVFSALTLLCGEASAGVINGACADDGGRFPQKCIKEIRIWNNTPGKIYVILQAGKQGHEAHNCPAKDGGGDVWLQGALGDRANCYKVTQDYHVYVNPETGIPRNSFVSIKLPFWSKREAGAPDTYIDWWRGGRVVIFDDKTALDDTYLKLKGRRQVQFAPGSPQPLCNDSSNNSCSQAELQIYQVPPAAQIAQHTPFQLNEFTFADVTPFAVGGDLISLNQNYNVSNVDQLYLPIAIEPVREPADVPYMGTTMSVREFRQKLQRFTGDPSTPNLLKWPVYNNPLRKKESGVREPVYPNAGIRVPSPLAAFNFYMSPSRFPPDPNKPDEPGEFEIIPSNPPSLLDRMMEQWRICTTGSAPCPDKKVYQQINDVFLANYHVYFDKKCFEKPDAPDYLKPVETNPARPKLTTFLRFVHGWVPFNTSCNVPELPTVAGGFRDTIDYINLQYNYLTRGAARWFNPYTRLIHGPESEGGLNANAYAFSIDDRTSFLNNSGGSLPGGLIIAVGGATGLVNGTQMPPPIPEYHTLWDFAVSLGPASLDGAQWARYGICSDTADTAFPPRGLDADGQPLGYVMGVDAVLQRNYPCNITFTDTKDRKYRIVVKQARIPPKPIWPDFTPSGSTPFDTDVVECPALDGFVAPRQWCKFTNEVAKPKEQGGPQYELGLRSPLP
jgi:hypothetical protein